MYRLNTSIRLNKKWENNRLITYVLRVFKFFYTQYLLCIIIYFIIFNEIGSICLHYVSYMYIME